MKLYIADMIVVFQLNFFVDIIYYFIS